MAPIQYFPHINPDNLPKAQTVRMIPRAAVVNRLAELRAEIEAAGIEPTNPEKFGWFLMLSDICDGFDFDQTERLQVLGAAGFAAVDAFLCAPVGVRL